MIQGLYAAANGMLTAEDRQAVVANNIANASTAGFKRQFAVQKGFYEVPVPSLSVMRLRGSFGRAIFLSVFWDVVVRLPTNAKIRGFLDEVASF